MIRLIVAVLASIFLSNSAFAFVGEPIELLRKVCDRNGFFCCSSRLPEVVGMRLPTCQQNLADDGGGSVVCTLMSFFKDTPKPDTYEVRVELSASSPFVLKNPLKPPASSKLVGNTPFKYYERVICWLNPLEGIQVGNIGSNKKGQYKADVIQTDQSGKSRYLRALGEIRLLP